MNEKSESIIISYLPFLGSLVIFLGMARLIFYYSSFGIKIVTFLEFSEILTSFFDILIVAVVMILLAFIQDFLVMNKIDREEKAEAQQQIFDESNFWKRLLKYFKYHDTYFYSSLTLFMVYWGWSFFNNIITYETLLLIPLMYLGVMTFLILFTEIDIKHRKLNSSKSVRRLYNILMLSLFILISLVVMTRQEVANVKDNKSFFGTTIRFNTDSTFISDSSNYYIGKTQSYLFIYHERIKSVDVIPIREVKQITFKTKIQEKN
jgi:hypothetical protein